ncbi:MAG: cyclopropane fatty acyl phospholipid synthase [Burkholderiales bacterium]|nr:MAG: cyclopropane fatty acyl phospholipid synthase [Burkholderiales bacterium]
MHQTLHPHSNFGERAGASRAPRVLASLAASAGVRFDGDAPWDIQVRDPAVYGRILRRGSLGFGEAYLDGQWECARLDELFCRLLTADADARLDRKRGLRHLGVGLRHTLVNLQALHRAFQVGERHYDIGNDVFEAMLGPSMIYSCGYWAGASTLEEAQRDKLDLICRKLELKPGERLLDIGCGWGGLARHAAEHYGVAVTGITVSREQLALGRERCAGKPIKLELMDYREVEGRFDKIASVGMFEHVGRKNYATFFARVAELLEPRGLFLLHTIGNFARVRAVDPWIETYIFPNGKIPAASEIARASEGRLLVEDWHNFGADYDRTLLAWWDNFLAAWPDLKTRYGERFFRMWKYYLHCCAGYFRARQGQVWQIVFSKRSRGFGYRSVR